MYIHEKKSLEEIIDFYKTEHNFTPSKRAYQTQFKRWDFPSKQNPAHKNEQLVARVKELWERNTTQREMLRILTEEEGFDVKERELMRLRTKNRWLLRVANGMKEQPADSEQDVMNQLQQAIYAEDAGDPEGEDQATMSTDGTLVIRTGSTMVPLQARAGSPALGPEVIAKRQERFEKLAAESDERWATRKRRRRTRGWAGLPADPPGPPRFPSETTIDESKVFLSLDNNMYRDIRTRFQRICEEDGVLKKTIAGPERWEAVKSRLIQESPHLQVIFWSSKENLDVKKLALDVVCTDVTKRMRTLERRMTIAEAKNLLGINPEQSRQIRNAFYTILKEDHFTSKLEAGDHHWKELKQRWISNSDLLRNILAPGDADPQHETKVKAMEIMCRDVMKRLRDDQTKQDLTRQTKTTSNFNPHDSLEPYNDGSQDDVNFSDNPHEALVQAAANAHAHAQAQAEAEAQQAQAEAQSESQEKIQSQMHAQAEAQAEAYALAMEHANMQIDPSLLLAAANDPSLMDQNAHEQFAEQQYTDQQYAAQASQTAYDPEPKSIAVYFRVHPDSEFSTSVRIWVSTLTSASMEELRQLVRAKLSNATVIRLWGIMKQAGNEVTIEIENDEEVGAYLQAVRGVKPAFSVQLTTDWEN